MAAEGGGCGEGLGSERREKVVNNNTQLMVLSVTGSR